MKRVIWRINNPSHLSSGHDTNYPSLTSILENGLYSPFFFNDPATTEIYTLPLHDALPICTAQRQGLSAARPRPRPLRGHSGTSVVEISVRLTGTCLDYPLRPAPGAASRQLPRKHHAASNPLDRKSTRLNSSHLVISYAVFC